MHEQEIQLGEALLDCFHAMVVRASVTTALHQRLKQGVGLRGCEMVSKEAHYSKSMMQTPSSSLQQIHQPPFICTHTLLSLLLIKLIYLCAVKGSHFLSLPLSASSVSPSTFGHTTPMHICSNMSSLKIKKSSG